MLNRPPAVVEPHFHDSTQERLPCEREMVCQTGGQQDSCGLTDSGVKARSPERRLSECRGFDVTWYEGVTCQAVARSPTEGAGLF